MTQRIRRLFLAVALAALAAAALVDAATTGLVVTRAFSSGSRVFVGVANPTSESQSGYLVLAVTVQGYPDTKVNSIPLTVPPQSTIGIDARYSASVSLDSAETSDTDHGQGVADVPDPIVRYQPIGDLPE